jgi:hypothetical protein
MTTSRRETDLLSAMLDLAWGQWTAIGVAGIRASEHTMADPEALLVATLSIGRYDARLFDEMLDWVATNARLLDVARLRRLGEKASPEQRRLLGVVAQMALDRGAQASIRKLADDLSLAREDSARYEVQPLFGGEGGDWLEADELFRRAGFARSTPALRGMSRHPNPDLPACLRFRARALVGPGARAEVLTYLWTHEWAHGRLIAQRASVTQAAVAEYLSALADVSLATKREDGRRTLYRAAPELLAVAGSKPVYVDWVRAWPALVETLDATRESGLSEQAAEVRLAEALIVHVPGLETEGMQADLPALEGWAKQPQRLAEALERVIERVRTLAR